MELRPYQADAIGAAYAAMKSPDPSLIVLPTGAGKSAVISTMALDVVNKWNGRVIILSHVKELIGQIANTIKRINWQAPVGIYSAGFSKKNGREKITVAGIQSVYRNTHDIGAVNLIIIDECHLIPPSGDGMYLTFFENMRTINPGVRVIGLTATDYRMGSGYIHGPDKFFKNICYEIGVKELINQGYLSKLRGKNVSEPDLASVHIRGGEYVAAELNAVMEDAEKVRYAVREIIHYGADRCGWLVFCCSVEHAKMVAAEFFAQSVMAYVVVGDTPSAERDDLVQKFKSKEIKCLVSVGVLTTGFDAPHVDLIALLRPTKSPGLYYQMVGRGLRKAEGKSDCLILDMAGCIFEHGPIDEIEITEKKKGKGSEAPVKECPACKEVLHASAIVCNYCGYEMPREKARHEATAYDASPLSGPAQKTTTTHVVKEMDWRVHKKNGDESAPKSLRVDYWVGLAKLYSEWVCIEHSGFARKKAEAWWREHVGGDCKFTNAVDAFDYLEENKPKKPDEITVEIGGKFPAIIAKKFPEDKTDLDEPAYSASLADQQHDDEVPF